LIFYNFCTIVSRKKCFTHSWQKCPPHLNNVLTLPSEKWNITNQTRTQACCQKIARRPTVETFCSCSMITAIRYMLGDTLFFSRITHHACDSIKLLRRTTSDFIAPNMSQPNSPDLNPVDYAIWSVIQQHVYETRVHDIDKLRQRLHCYSLLHVWHGLEQSLIDDALNQWQMRLCLCQWRTFWTYFVTINLFSLYLMNFMFHTMLDAACNIRVHYKSMKSDVSFSLGRVSTLFRWGGHFCHVCVKYFFLLTIVQQL